MCRVRRISIHLLQSTLYWLFCLVFDVFCGGVLLMSEPKRQRFVPVYHFLGWGVPLICLICTAALDYDRAMVEKDSILLAGPFQ